MERPNFFSFETSFSQLTLELRNIEPLKLFVTHFAQKINVSLNVIGVQTVNQSGIKKKWTAFSDRSM